MLLRVASIGENLKRLRGRMSQEELAEAAGVKQGDVSKWEKNKARPNLISALKLAKAIRCSVDDLVVGLNAEYDALRSDLLRHHDPASFAAAHSQSQHQGGPDATSADPSRRQLAHELRDIADSFRGAIQDVADRLAGDVATTTTHDPDRATSRGKAPRVRGSRKVG